MQHQHHTAQDTAWAFAITHLSEIRRIAGKSRFRRHHVDPDEFVQDMLVRVVERFPLYDASRGTPAQWLFCLAMWTTRDADRRARRVQNQDPIDAAESVEIPIPAGRRGSLEQTEAIVMVSQIFDRATADQRAACETVLEGLSGSEVQDRLGISGHGRNFRISRLRETITQTQERA